MSENDSIKLYLVSGFLGSGKTSFLQSVLKDLPRSRVGVIVNDFGSIGVDGAVLKDDEIKLVEINNGSIFCACLKGGFIRTLAAFAEQSVDYLFVEASGLADPDNMTVYLEQVRKMAEQNREKAAKKGQTVSGRERPYDYRGGICVVDAVNYEDLSDVFPVLESQVRKSRFLLINKCSDVEGPDLERLKNLLKDLNPEAVIYTTDYGRVPVDIIEEQVMADPSVGGTLNTPWNRPASFALTIPDGLQECTLREFINDLAPLTIRMKGFARVLHDGMGDSSGRLTYLIHIEGVGQDLQVTPYENKETSRTQLVLIGVKDRLTEAVIRRIWNRHFETECLLEED